MNTKDIVPSLIRTWVPIIVATLVSVLGQAGIVLPEDASAGLATFLGGLFGAVYYLVVRLLEYKFPGIGVFLLSTKKPEYQPEHRA